MSEEWFEVAYINFDEAILWGRMTAGQDEEGVRQECEVRIELSADQRRQIEGMQGRHHAEMQKLLRAMAA